MEPPKVKILPVIRLRVEPPKVKILPVIFPELIDNQVQLIVSLDKVNVS